MLSSRHVGALVFVVLNDFIVGLRVVQRGDMTGRRLAAWGEYIGDECMD